MRCAALFLLLAIGAGPIWAGDVYKWDDEAGVTRYSDHIPPPGARNVHKYKATSGSLSMEKPAVAAKEPSAPVQQPETKIKEKPEVTLFSFDECGEVCKQAEDLLKKRGVPYTRKGSNKDKIELQQLTGKLDVPVLVIGDSAPVQGYQEERWNKELDLAGYARSGGELAAQSKPAAAGADR